MPDLDPKATYTVIGAILSFLSIAIARLLGFLDGGRKHRLDQLNLALEQVKVQQDENSKIRAEHETKIAVLEQKVENLQANLLENKNLLLQEKNEKLMVIQELQSTKRALEESQKREAALESTVKELTDQLTKERRRKSREDS